MNSSILNTKEQLNKATDFERLVIANYKNCPCSLCHILTIPFLCITGIILYIAFSLLGIIWALLMKNKKLACIIPQVFFSGSIGVLKRFINRKAKTFTLDKNTETIKIKEEYLLYIWKKREKTYNLSEITSVDYKYIPPDNLESYSSCDYFGIEIVINGNEKYFIDKDNEDYARDVVKQVKDFLR